MKRNEAIAIILDYLNEEDIALFSTGMISREAFSIKDRPTNFYMLGSMGLVSALGLGIGLNTLRRVFILDGDGSVLMDMGTMTIIGTQKPNNLVHIVLDNESYQSTGGQPTPSKIVRLDKIAIDSGYLYSRKVNTPEGLKSALKDSANKKGPSFILVKVLDEIQDSAKRVSLAPLQIKQRFEQVLRKEKECRQLS